MDSGMIGARHSKLSQPQSCVELSEGEPSLNLPDNLPDEMDCDAASQRERIERLRRGSIWFLAVMLLAVLVGLMIGRVVHGQIPWGGVMPTANNTAAQVLAVAAKPAGDGLSLTLQLQHPPRYQRIEQDDAVLLRLLNANLPGAAQSGRLYGEQALSWRVENSGNDVQVLLVGLGAKPLVRERLEQVGALWQLRVTVTSGH